MEYAEFLVSTPEEREKAWKKEEEDLDKVMKMTVIIGGLFIVVTIIAIGSMIGKALFCQCNPFV